MTPNNRAYEQAEDDLIRMHREGALSKDELNAELRQMGRDYADEAREAADAAYRDEIGSW